MRYNVGDLIMTVSCYDRTPFSFWIKSILSKNEVEPDFFGDPPITLARYDVYILLNTEDKPIKGIATEHIGRVTIINCKQLQCESSWQEEHILKYNSKTTQDTDELWKKLNKGIYRS